MMDGGETGHGLNGVNSQPGGKQGINGRSYEDIDIMLNNYEWLRNEIDQAYQRQFRIVISQAMLIGIAVGFKFTIDLSGNQYTLEQLENVINFILYLIPPIVLASAALWLLEQNRIMRAGNYLQILEHRINKKADGNPLSWETWLRNPLSLDPDNTWKKTINRYISPHNLFDICHLIGYPVFFSLSGITSLLLIISTIYEIPLSDLNQLGIYIRLFTDSGLETMAYFIPLLLSFISLIPLMASQTHHQWHDQSSKIDRFDDWLACQFDDVPNDATIGLHTAFQEYDEELQDLDLRKESYSGRFEEIIQKAKEASLHDTSSAGSDRSITYSGVDEFAKQARDRYDFEVKDYKVPAKRTRSPPAAAEAIGCEPAKIVSSVAFLVNDDKMRSISEQSSSDKKQGTNEMSTVETRAGEAYESNKSREELVVVITNRPNLISEAKLADLQDVFESEVETADPDTIEKTLGWSIGGVPPFCHDTDVPVYLDEALTEFDTVWAAAGTPEAVFPIDLDTLQELSGAETADVVMRSPSANANREESSS